MTIYECSRSMTSSVTPDWAWRPSRRSAEPAWRLSWTPEPCTREQARAAMELREQTHRDLAADPAAERGEHGTAPLRRVINSLYLRILARRRS
ncbi:hypothetical protein AB0H76_18985 [Nocardia sp. NPDC050712]|uniref:hypothetical protein n=1 Tax=Nocardia sp. NPDC050712 TaxID=3155518 RepID=UPI0033EDCA87